MSNSTTPAPLAEQERVLKLLEGITPGEWEVVGETTVWIGEDDFFWVHAEKDAALIAAAPDIARAYLALLDAHLALRAQLAQAGGREKALREDALKAIDAAIQCESDVLDVYQRRVSLTTLDLAVADMKQDSLPKLKAARAALAQAGEG